MLFSKLYLNALNSQLIATVAAPGGKVKAISLYFSRFSSQLIIFKCVLKELEKFDGLFKKLFARKVRRVGFWPLFPLDD